MPTLSLTNTSSSRPFKATPVLSEGPGVVLGSMDEDWNMKISKNQGPEHRAQKSRALITKAPTKQTHNLWKQLPAPQLPFKRPQIPSIRDHKALHRGTLGGAGIWDDKIGVPDPQRMPGLLGSEGRAGLVLTSAFSAASRDRCNAYLAFLMS